ncbi:MAG: hypothetical protein HYZ16_06990 [Bacteroidetes bacterium]|nr:hypothetical protein [Bacteroidota bacterium]
MDVIFKNAQRVGPKGQPEKVHLHIANGRVAYIGHDMPNHAAEMVDTKGAFFSVGWFDPLANFCEPGLEHKEDIESGARVAIRGGFTRVGVLPDTDPVLDSNPQLAYIVERSRGVLPHVHVLPSFVKRGNHGELSEVLEMEEAGALAFAQPRSVMLHSSVVLKSMEYLRPTGKRLVLYVNDKKTVPGAFVHEGMANVQMGMRGIPDFCEEVLVKQYIELLRYTQSSCHLSGISSRKSLPYIEKAKHEGLDISCDVSVNQLLFNEYHVLGFDTNYKLEPPLRSEDDQLALIEAVKSGLIDVVTAQHQPHEADAKRTEIHLAEFGVIGLQTVFPLLCQVFSVEKAVEILAVHNRRPFGVAEKGLNVGDEAEITFYMPDTTWVFDEAANESKSANSMSMGKLLKGKAVGVVAKGQFAWYG